MENFSLLGNLSLSNDQVFAQVTNMLMLGGFSSSQAASIASVYFGTTGSAEVTNTTTDSASVKDIYLRDPDVHERIKRAYAADYAMIGRAAAKQLQSHLPRESAGQKALTATMPIAWVHPCQTGSFFLNTLIHPRLCVKNGRR